MIVALAISNPCGVAGTAGRVVMGVVVSAVDGCTAVEGAAVVVTTNSVVDVVDEDEAVGCVVVNGDDIAGVVAFVSGFAVVSSDAVSVQPATVTTANPSATSARITGPRGGRGSG